MNLSERAMPDDLSSSVTIPRMGGQPPEDGADDQRPAADQREKSCDFGSCSFVTYWYKKINSQPGSAGARGNIGSSGLEAESCPKCHGMFSSDSSLLPGIRLGSKDKMGQTIIQIYQCGEDYIIYRTHQGVKINFADCRAREREQRAHYAEISQKLCRLRFLISQMARWVFSFGRLKKGGFYDHQIAEAIYLALQDKADDANQILDTGLTLAEERITNENRVRYLLACLLIGLVPVATLWTLFRHGGLVPNEMWLPYLIAAAAGSAGAVFSIALRVQDLELKPFAQSVMNYVMGALRVLIGFVAGAVILLIINGTVFGEGVKKVFEPDSLSALTADSWKCIVLVGFLGGFAERLVPSLLQNLQGSVENRVTDAAGKTIAGEKGPLPALLARKG
jgi:hypothetical protein